MTIELVVARYNEDISWLNKIKNKNIKITIYNKGGNLNVKNIKLPNVGRESHTYLTHIINNYKSLADTTIFTQADPFLHSPHFIELLDNIDLFQPIQPLTSFYSPSYDNASNSQKEYILSHKLDMKGIPPKNVYSKTKNLSIKNINIFVEYLDKNFVPKYPCDYYPKIIGFFNYLKTIFKFDNILKFVKTRYKIDNIQLTKLIPVSYCGIFSVSKNIILDRNVKFYQNILDLLLSDYENYKVDTGHLLERLWMSIFNYQKYNKNYISFSEKNFIPKYKTIKIPNNNIYFLIETENPIFLIIKMDGNLYYLNIYSDKITFKKQINLIKKIKSKIFNTIINKYKTIKYNKVNVQLRINHNNTFQLIINNKTFINLKIQEHKLESIKIEKNYYSIQSSF